MPIPASLGWYEIPSTQMGQVCQNGVNTCGAVISAWNSGAMDTLRNRLIIWGGGHHDYAGNEIYALNLNDPPNFQRLTTSTAGGCSAYSCDGGVTPNVRHTYGSLCYMANIDRLFVFGGSAAGAGTLLNDTWTFSFATMTWHYMNPSGTIPPAEISIAAYDALTGKVFLHTTGHLYSYTFSTNTYVQLVTQSMDYHLHGVIDPVRRQFLCFGGGEQHIVNLASPFNPLNNAEYGSTGGSAIINANYPGLAYDPLTDRVIGYAGGDSVYSLNLDTKVWTQITHSGGPGANASQAICSHFSFVPALGVFAFVNQQTQNAYALRTTTSVVDTEDPTAPSSLVATAISPFQVNLSWGASTDDVGVSGYQIERCSGAACSSFAQIAGTGGLTYSDTTAVQNTLYRYRVRAADQVGNFSTYSNIAEATTPVAPPGWFAEYWNSGTGGSPTMPVTAPNLTRTDAEINFNFGNGGPGAPINSDHFIARWTRTDTFVAGTYLFSATTDDGMRVYVDDVIKIDKWFNQPSTNYTALVAVSAGEHEVRVEYYENTGGAVAIMNYTLDSAVTDTEAPTAPTDVVASVMSSSRIDLVWTASTDNVAVVAYSIERCSGAACSNFVEVATPNGPLNFSDIGLAGGTLYRYRLRARDAANNYSSYSAIIEATTDPVTTNVRQVGPTRPYTTILAGYNAAIPGDFIEIDPGIYQDESFSVAKANLTFRGVSGSAKAGTAAHMRWDTGNYLTATTNIPNGQAILKVTAPNCLFDNIEFSGAKVADDNGAAFRYAVNGDLTIRNCYIHDCQEGLLGQGGPLDTLTMEFNRIDDCGNIDGPSHNVYVSGNMGNFIFRYNSSINSREGHTLKSRAHYNEIVSNRLSTKDDTGSFEADFPDGGIVIFIGNQVEQGVNTENSTMLAYALESGINQQHELYVVHNTFYNHRVGGTFVQKGASITMAQLVIKNNIFAGSGTIFSGGTTDTSSNLSPSDASFVDPANSDFHLVTGSPAINAAVPAGSTADGYNLLPTYMYVDVGSRVQRFTYGTTPDVGAYEFFEGGSPPPPPVKAITFSRRT